MKLRIKLLTYTYIFFAIVYSSVCFVDYIRNSVSIPEIPSIEIDLIKTYPDFEGAKTKK